MNSYFIDLIAVQLEQVTFLQIIDLIAVHHQPFQLHEHETWPAKEDLHQEPCELLNLQKGRTDWSLYVE